MGCCGQAEEGDEEKKARKQNKKIENQIQKDKQVRLGYRVLRNLATLMLMLFIETLSIVYATFP